jgi:hypothetical protein
MKRRMAERKKPKTRLQANRDNLMLKGGPSGTVFTQHADLEVRFRELDERFFGGCVAGAGWRVFSADTQSRGPLHRLSHAGDLDLMGLTIFELYGRKWRIIGIDQDIADRAYGDTEGSWVYASILHRTLLHEMAHALTEETSTTTVGDPHVRRRFLSELRRLGRLGERWAPLEAQYFRTIPVERRAEIDLPDWLAANGYASEYYS